MTKQMPLDYCSNIKKCFAKFHLHQKTAQPEKIVPLIERILKGNTKNSSDWEKEKINSERFKGSFEIVDQYWNQRNQAKNR